MDKTSAFSTFSKLNIAELRHYCAILKPAAAHNPEIGGSSPPSATIQMYAYVDGESSVSAGVYFFYMLSQELRQIRVSVLGGLPEDFHDLLRIHGSTARRPAPDDVLQLPLADSEPIHLLMQFGKIIEAVQNPM